MNTLRSLLLFGILSLFPFSGYATHIFGGDFQIECLGNDQYVVQLRLFRHCAGIPMTATQNITLTSPCGSMNATLPMIPDATTTSGGTNVSPYCPAELGNTDCDAGNLSGVDTYVYADTITITPACDSWSIAWNTCCRGSIINLSNGNSDVLYIEASINTADAPCNSTPTWNNHQAPYWCVGNFMTWDFGVTEMQGDSVVYSLVDALGAGGVPVAYGAGFSGNIPLQNMVIDPATGVLSCTPTQLGTYVVVVMAEEYNTQGTLISSITRDIHVTVFNCSGTAPTIIDSMISITGAGQQLNDSTFGICEGQQLYLNFLTEDVEGDSVFIHNVALHNLSGVTTGGWHASADTLHAIINWPNAQPAAGNQQQSITFCLTDNACPLPRTRCYEYYVIVNPPGNTGMSIVNQTNDVCLDSAQLTTTYAGGGTETYSWEPAAYFNDPSIASPVFTAPATGDYNVTVTVVDTGVCIEYDSAIVSYVNPIASFTLSDTSICEGDSLQLISSSSTGLLHHWEPASEASSPNSSSTYAAPDSSQTYWLIVSDSSGSCIDSTSHLVNVHPAPVTGQIYGELLPEAILGTEDYSVTGLPGSTYFWTTQTGTIQSGQGTDEIEVMWQGTFPQYDSICVTETSAFGCEGQLSCIDLVVVMNIDEQLSSYETQLYPNPASTHLTIQTKAIAYQVLLVDAQGKEVFVEHVSGPQNHVINLAAVEAGHYQVIVVYDDGAREGFQLLKTK